MLVAASVIGGLGTPIGLILLVRLARNPKVMNNQPISPRLAIAGWTVAVIVGGFGLAYVGWGIQSQF
jgi:Mn2+/Fe2+ NRAMP family transporter